MWFLLFPPELPIRPHYSPEVASRKPGLGLTLCALTLCPPSDAGFLPSHPSSSVLCARRSHPHPGVEDHILPPPPPPRPLLVTVAPTSESGCFSTPGSLILGYRCFLLSTSDLVPRQTPRVFTAPRVKRIPGSPHGWVLAKPNPPSSPGTRPPSPPPFLGSSPTGCVCSLADPVPSHPRSFTLPLPEHPPFPSPPWIPA